MVLGEATERFEREFYMELEAGLKAAGISATTVVEDEVQGSLVFRSRWLTLDDCEVSEVHIVGHGDCCPVGVWCHVPDARITEESPSPIVRSRRKSPSLFGDATVRFEPHEDEMTGSAEPDSRELAYASLVADHLNGDSYLIDLLRSESSEILVEVEPEDRRWDLQVESFWGEPKDLVLKVGLCHRLTGRLLTFPAFE